MTEQDPNTTGPAKQGLEPSVETPERLAAAVDLAFDYRGDVTVHLKDGGVVEGFVYDRREDAGASWFRMWPKDSDERLKILYAEVSRLVFTGRDTAAGKSWETWVRKYLEARQRGEKATMGEEGPETAGQ